MRTDNEIIRDLMDDYALTFEEKTRIVEWAKTCYKNPNLCPEDCPLRKYKYDIDCINCTDFFARFIVNNGLRLSTSVIVEQDADIDYKSINDLMKDITKLANEIKIKTKRETPMQVVVSHSNGKTIYHCYNCGKPLFIQPSTQYCECCGQKLSFEVVENEI